MPFQLLNEEELADLEREDLEKYANELVTKGNLIRYYLKNPGAKFWKRVNALSEGKDPDEVAPKKRQKISSGRGRGRPRKVVEEAENTEPPLKKKTRREAAY